MKLSALSPIIWTENLEETIDFYTAVLLFSLEEKNNDWEWVSLHKDEVRIMIAKLSCPKIG